MKRITAGLVLALVTMVVPAVVDAQNTPSTSWKSEVVTDALRGTQHSQYELEGVYLTPPQGVGAGETPSLVLRCLADPNAAHGHARGKFLEGYVHTHSVVDSGGASGGQIQVHYRRDDGKVQEGLWNHSTDFSSAFFDDVDLNTLMFGHFMPHKEGTGPQTHKLVIAMSEFMGSEVVVQFNLPDDNDPVETCGVLWHK
jgi:hypothetical protein